MMREVGFRLAVGLAYCGTLFGMLQLADGKRALWLVILIAAVCLGLLGVIHAAALKAYRAWTLKRSPAS